MMIREYLDKHRMTASAMAELLGVEVSTVTRMARREKAPSLALALRIQILTNGDVMASDLALSPPPATDAEEVTR